MPPLAGILAYVGFRSFSGQLRGGRALYIPLQRLYHAGMTTYYEILGVERDASAEAIRRAFRDRAKERHPDTEAGSEAGMVLLNQAYDTLKDARRRREYDASLHPVLASYGPDRRPTRPRPRPSGGPDPLLFLVQVFQPLDKRLVGAIADLNRALEEVAYDIYDDTYIARFERAVAATETLVSGLGDVLQRSDWPAPLMNALNLYGQSIRQVEDALADFRDFGQSFDVDTLVQGRAILDAAVELLDEAREGMGGF